MNQINNTKYQLEYKCTDTSITKTTNKTYLWRQIWEFLQQRKTQNTTHWCRVVFDMAVKTSAKFGQGNIYFLSFLTIHLFIDSRFMLYWRISYNYIKHYGGQEASQKMGEPHDLLRDNTTLLMIGQQGCHQKAELELTAPTLVRGS